MRRGLPLATLGDKLKTSSSAVGVSLYRKLQCSIGPPVWAAGGPDRGFLALEPEHRAMFRMISNAKRFKLYHGPYKAPKCRVGDWLDCEYRGREVKVRGMSDAPIPWPSTRRTGRLSLIVCGDLVRAVRLESERAVAYHWGVCCETVWKWRKALDVPAWNEGSRRLHAATQCERYDPEILERARKKSRTPKARAKMSETRKKMPLHPNFRAAAATASRLPKPESFRRKLSQRVRREWRQGLRHGHTTGRLWTKAELARLGKDTDETIAQELGRTKNAVQKARLVRGIRTFVRNSR